MFASMFRRLPRDRPLLGLALAALVLAAAGLARVMFGDPDQAFEPMALLPATLLGGVVGGMRIGVAIFVVCLLTAWIWFFPPNGTLILSRHDAVTVALFALTAILELFVVRILNLAINDLTEARERSNTLFRELQHRVANNLQFAVAVLHASRRTLAADSAGSKALDGASNRLGLMSRVHRRLHDPSMTKIPLGTYLEGLCRDLIDASGSADIELKVEVSDVRLDIDALITLSLIVAEMVTNSLKHAFGDRMSGLITVGLTVKDEVCTLTVADNGRGCSPQFANPKSGGLGRDIMTSLASQLHGDLSFRCNGGATAQLIFPRPRVKSGH